MGIGFQIISCPIGGEPTAVTTDDDYGMVIISEIPHLELDSQEFEGGLGKEVTCPEGHTFYVYTVPSGMISL
ncbi:MAG: hypothetical protein J4N99_07760 [Chloroflexi bacterium]|nr:hypothetical protein [Chloroflexota bacterium]MCI0813353.1 hypothetical protein [Chloroflexota bacterium]MCI0822008.1 hypothetical protein [Chloroflexota bacterium]MCI0886786.1 hypothetical protein [Chloroflexota bacterium]